MNIIIQNNLFTVMIKAVLPFQLKMDVKEMVRETLPSSFFGYGAKNAMKLYQEKANNPNSNLSKRCCDFKLLEEKSKLYNKKQKEKKCSN